MLSLLSLLPLAGTALSLETSLHTAPHLDPTIPIYLGEVFWPPSMTFIAWLPSEVHEPLEVGVKGLTNYNTKQVPYTPYLDWCYKATECGNGLFSLAGVDALKMHDYFSESAYISREGKRYANCSITPESGRIGACEGVIDFECEGGHKFTGPGTRKWSCWVIPEVVKNGSQVVAGVVVEGEKLTDAIFEPTAVVTGAMSSEGIGAFTAGATGS